MLRGSQWEEVEEFIERVRAVRSGGAREDAYSNTPQSTGPTKLSYPLVTGGAPHPTRLCSSASLMTIDRSITD